MNNTFNWISIKKKGPHNRGAGWWGTLYLKQFLRKCNPLSIAQKVQSGDTTDSVSMISFIVALLFWKNYVI